MEGLYLHGTRRAIMVLQNIHFSQLVGLHGLEVGHRPWRLGTLQLMRLIELNRLVLKCFKLKSIYAIQKSQGVVN